MARSAHRALVRWGFARLYHEFAHSYDAVAYVVSRGLWRRWALSALRHLGPGLTLELGCGTGNLQRALAQAGHAHAGLDASPQMLTIARSRLRRAGLPLRLVRATAQRLPLAAASVGTVVATFPSEYILHPATLAEVARVLAADGRLVIVAAARFEHDGLYERLVDLAYRLTLQGSPRQLAPTPDPADDPQLAPIQLAGFRVEQFWQPVEASQVLTLIARRAASSNPQAATSNSPAAAYGADA